MIITEKSLSFDFEKIGESKFWGSETTKEIRMHKIHSYPAKFPSLLVSKAIEYSKINGIKVNSMSDVFCGCGTTALEAKKNNINFWGCDINPVATLIARVKSNQHDSNKLNSYYRLIDREYKSSNYELISRIRNNERIEYWFDKEHIQKLNNLLISILNNTPNGKYQDFFLCGFSNILKPVSRWLTKSIKPQIDPIKLIPDVWETFGKQFTQMLRANNEAILSYESHAETLINTGNFLQMEWKKPFTDLVVTSPPYVTSYEYADLHQLSTLWLGYVEDYRNLRKGTIGSLYHEDLCLNDIDNLPEIGKSIYKQLLNVDKRIARSAVKYFIDMQLAVTKIYEILLNRGLAVFVIGNTRYKNVSVDNAKFLARCMMERGFKNIEISKRKINSKILTPYRDGKGRFSRDPKDTKVYSHEFILIGRK